MAELGPLKKHPKTIRVMYLGAKQEQEDCHGCMQHYTSKKVLETCKGRQKRATEMTQSQ